MLEDCIKHYDDFKKLSFKSLTSMGLKLLMYLLKQLNDTKNKIVELDFNMLNIIFDKKLNDRNFESLVRRSVWNISKQVIVFKNSNDIILSTPFFEQIRIVLQDKKVIATFNERFSNTFLQIRLNSNIDLDEMQYFKSKYSIIIYKHLKKYKDQGKYVIDNIDQFKNDLGIETQSNSFLVRKILHVMQKEISQSALKNFKINVIKDGKGGKTNKLKEIVFTWDKA